MQVLLKWLLIFLVLFGMGFYAGVLTVQMELTNAMEIDGE